MLAQATYVRDIVVGSVVNILGLTGTVRDAFTGAGHDSKIYSRAFARSV